MQIATSVQSNFITQASTEPLKNNSVVSENNTNNITDTVNKNASDYIDLGVDISDFVKVDTVHDQTNKELVGYLTSIIDNESIEGKKNLIAYDIHHYKPSFADFQKHLDEMGGIEHLNSITAGIAENIRKRNQDGYVLVESKKDLTSDKPSSLLRALEEGKPGVGTYYFDTFKEITKKEAEILNIEKFKNLYSFSEDFAQTKVFEDLYQQYKEQRLEKAYEDLDSGKDYYEGNGVERMITSDVVSKNLSKSEVIEHYTGISNDLKDKLAENLKIPESSKIISNQYMKDTIKLYDKMTADLKNMWGFGDLDILA